MLHRAQSCSIMLHELIKLLLPEFEDKPVSLTSYMHFKAIESIELSCKLPVCIQKAAEKLCQTAFQSLSSRHKASANGLLCKLLDSYCWQPLQIFCPTLIFVTLPCLLRYVNDDPLLLQSCVKYNSLDIFRNSFLGMIPIIWSVIPLTLRERGATEGCMVCHLPSFTEAPSLI